MVSEQKERVSGKGVQEDSCGRSDMRSKKTEKNGKKQLTESKFSDIISHVAYGEISKWS